MTEFAFLVKIKPFLCHKNVIKEVNINKMALPLEWLE